MQDDHTTQSTQVEFQREAAGPNPTGLCMCGCGQITPLAKRTRSDRGDVKGQHQRYVPGHYARQAFVPPPPDPSALCECGCGQPAPIAKYTDTRRGYERGKPVRYIKGHSHKSRQEGEGPNPGGLCMCGCGQPAPIAKSSDPQKDYVFGKPVRYIAGHFKLPNRHSPAIERFWQSVQKTEGCWLWTGGRSRGYGNLGVNGKPTPAHRFSWELHNGPIPDGFYICHHCDNPACVRPDHLFLGTPLDNALDREAKGRGNQPRGQGNAKAKLTPEQVRKIRKLAREGASRPSLAEEFGVSSSAVRSIVERKNWRHI